LKKNEKILLAGWIMTMLFILLVLVTFFGCDSGWSVAGWEI